MNIMFRRPFAKKRFISTHDVKPCGLKASNRRCGFLLANGVRGAGRPRVFLKSLFATTIIIFSAVGGGYGRIYTVRRLVTIGELNSRKYRREEVGVSCSYGTYYIRKSYLRHKDQQVGGIDISFMRVMLRGK